MALIGGNIGFTGYQQPNYAGVVEAAGLPMQAIGQGIAQAQDYFKQQGEKKKLIKKSDVQIDAALKLFPDLAPTLQGVRDQIKDENISLDERAGIAESVAGLINMGTNQMQAMADYGLKKRQLDIEEGRVIQSAKAEANKPTKLKRSAIKLGNETEVDVLEDDYGNVYDPQTKSRILDLQGFANGLPLSQVTEQFDASGLPVAYGGEIPTNTGGVLPDLEKGNVPTLSADAQAAADIGGAIYPDGVPVEGTPIAGAGDQIAAASQIAAPVVPQASAEGVQTALDITSPQPQTLTPRARQIKKEGFREFTPEEVVKYGSPGQINTKNNEVKLLSPPVGRSWKVSPDGTVEVIEGVGVGGGKAGEPKVGEGQMVIKDPSSPTGTRVVNIPGGKAEAEAKQAASAEEAAKVRGVELGTVALAEIDRFIDYTDQMSGLPFASPLRKGMAALGMEQQAEAQSSLDTVAANLKFEALDALRKSSPTGASGLGQVTQNEFSALADQWGTLRLVGDPKMIRERAISVKKKLLDTVHGNQQHRDALLKKGVITKEQYNAVQSQYPGSQQGTEEDANLTRWRTVFPSSQFPPDQTPRTQTQ